jgi:biotin carboxyl carrier protein
MMTGSDIGNLLSFSVSEIVRSIIAIPEPSCNHFNNSRDLFRPLKSELSPAEQVSRFQSGGTPAVSNEAMTYRDLLELVELIKSSSQFGEFHVKLGDLEVDLRRAAAVDAVQPTAQTQATARSSETSQARAPAAVPSNAAASDDAAGQEPASRQRYGHVGGGEIVTDPVPREPGNAPGTHAAPLAFPPDALLIKSPMVGMFYRASEPGARPFVEVGQQVDAETTVCIIEVMKLMNSIAAGKKGTITHILVRDSEPVEYGQVLMVVDPA